MKKKPYTCPRCGYVTALKTDMFKHLYKLKKTCPGQESLIELTEEVKQSILNNRVYIPEKVHQPNTVINNYNNVNNFIAGLDVLEKLSKYMKHKNTGLIGFEQAIEDKYSRTVRKLEDDSWKYGFELKRDDLLDIIDQISKVELTVDSVKTFEDLNIYYDKNADKLKIYDGEWEEMLTNKGIKKIVEVIKDCYWSNRMVVPVNTGEFIASMSLFTTSFTTAMTTLTSQLMMTHTKIQMGFMQLGAGLTKDLTSAAMKMDLNFLKLSKDMNVGSLKLSKDMISGSTKLTTDITKFGAGLKLDMLKNTKDLIFQDKIRAQKEAMDLRVSGRSNFMQRVAQFGKALAFIYSLKCLALFVKFSINTIPISGLSLG